MLNHDLLTFCALLASGVVGALVASPVGRVVAVAVERTRAPDRRR